MKPALIGGVIFVMVILIIAVISFRSDDTKPVEETAPKQQEEAATQEEKLENMSEPAVAPIPESVEEDEPAEKEVAPQPVAVEEVSKDEPDTDPTKVKGLVGHYTADSFDERANVWKDTSGNGNDADEVKGEPEVVEEDGFKFVLGGATSGVRFPSAVLTNGRKYTMIAVTRVNSPASGGRVFDGYGNSVIT